MSYRKFHPCLIAFLAAFLALVSSPTAPALPQILNHQGRIAVDGVNFQGEGQFKFALVNAEGTLVWSNAEIFDQVPNAAVPLTLNKGLYSVLLGDTTLLNMDEIPAALFNEHRQLSLRVWFDDGTNGFQQITPDQRFAVAPFAVVAEQAKTAVDFSGVLLGDVTGSQGTTSIADETVTAKTLSGFDQLTPLTGGLSTGDTILSAFVRLQGNASLKAPLDSPTFTGTVSGITAGMVGLGSVNNTADAAKPISVAQQTALDLKAPLASPTFTGTVSGITAEMVGLGSVDNTADADKPVSSAQQAALNSKAPLASPTFTGTVQLPAGTNAVAPMKLASGANLTTPAFGAVEFDGTNLYLTNNSASPTRKTLAFTDSAPSVNLSQINAAPVLPVLAWGENDNRQTTVPSLSNVSTVAAAESHSLALLNNGTVVTWGNGPAIPSGLDSVVAIAAGSSHDIAVRDDGTVLAWGGNGYGQATVPIGITNATQAAAGERHSLILHATGEVTAWGNNIFGQITVPSAATSNVTAIAAGYDHSLALKSDGTVVAWGRNEAGQSEVPEGLNDVIAIGAGAFHSLAVKSDGTVVAWGWDNGGQSSVPADLTGVTKVVAGYVFSAALKSDGTIVAWGSNTDGQLTIPSSATQVTQLAAGSSHMLALRADLIPAQLARLDQDNVFAGKVGIKRVPATHALEVEGNASKTTATNWLANSDRRIKTDVTTLTGALEIMDQVRLVDFRYTEEYRKTHPSIEDSRYLNVIAQEFQQVFPDHVKESGEFLSDGSPILQVDTYPLTIYSAAAVQELHRENRDLKQRLSDQETRLRKLEEMMETR